MNESNSRSFQDLAWELSKLLNNAVITTYTNRGIIKVTGENGNRSATIIYQESEYNSYDEKQGRKSDYKDEVKRLYNEGFKQNDIALSLGISQSLVSKLLKQ